MFAEGRLEEPDFLNQVKAKKGKSSWKKRRQIRQGKGTSSHAISQNFSIEFGVPPKKKQLLALKRKPWSQGHS
jgi:hypothetical protein